MFIMIAIAILLSPCSSIREYIPDTTAIDKVDPARVFDEIYAIALEAFNKPEVRGNALRTRRIACSSNLHHDNGSSTHPY